MSDDTKLTEVLPVTRVAPSLRARLDRLAASSIAPRVSDHIRYAVERYIDAEEQKLGLAPMPTTGAESSAGAW